MILILQTITYTLARADVQVGNEEDREPERDPRRNKRDGDDDTDSQTIRAQNQVALILICEFNDTDDKECHDVFDGSEITRLKTRPPPVIIATTHLKVSRNLKSDTKSSHFICIILALLASR